MKKFILIILLLNVTAIWAQTGHTIEIGTFNMEWFPCKDDGNMMHKYGIDLRYPPKGNATDIKALFSLLKDLDIELLGVEEIVDPQMLADSAKKYLGEQYEFIYARLKRF